MEDKPVPETITIDCKTIDSIKELHRLLAKELDFPAFYGHNWNAFWDAITGLVEMPRKLVFINFKNLKTMFPEQWQIMEDCLTDMNTKYSSINCKVVYNE